MKGEPGPGRPLSTSDPILPPLMNTGLPQGLSCSRLGGEKGSGGDGVGASLMCMWSPFGLEAPPLKHEGHIRHSLGGPARGCPTPPTVRAQEEWERLPRQQKEPERQVLAYGPGTWVCYLGSRGSKSLRGGGKGGWRWILGKRCRCFEDSWERRAGRGEQVWLQFTKWPPEVDPSLAQWSPGPALGPRIWLSPKLVSPWPRACTVLAPCALLEGSLSSPCGLPTALSGFCLGHLSPLPIPTPTPVLQEPRS